MTLTISPFGLPLSQPAPLPSATASGWRLQERPGTGLFVVSEAGTLLFRIEPDKGLIYSFDKKVGREVPVPVCLLPFATV